MNFLIFKVYFLIVELVLEVNNCLIMICLCFFNLFGMFFYVGLFLIIYNENKVKIKINYFCFIKYKI